MLKNYLHVKESINGLSERDINDVLVKQVFLYIFKFWSYHLISSLNYFSLNYLNHGFNKYFCNIVEFVVTCIYIFIIPVPLITCMEL